MSIAVHAVELPGRTRIKALERETKRNECVELQRSTVRVFRERRQISRC
jgi:hypothetical protein